MRLIILAVAALLTTGIAAAPASANGFPPPGHGQGWNHGGHHGWNRGHRRCRTEWRHHHRVRRCW